MSDQPTQAQPSGGGRVKQATRHAGVLRSVADAVYERLGEEWGGNASPPGDHLGIDLPMRGSTHRDDRYVVRTNNDGFELWIGTPHEWYWHCSAADARKVAWFVLWRWWGVGTWFGLRRKLWYWALRQRVKR